MINVADLTHFLGWHGGTKQELGRKYLVNRVSVILAIFP